MKFPKEARPRPRVTVVVFLVTSCLLSGPGVSAETTVVNRADGGAATSRSALRTASFVEQGAENGARYVHSVSAKSAAGPSGSMSNMGGRQRAAASIREK